MSPTQEPTSDVTATSSTGTPAAAAATIVVALIIAAVIAAVVSALILVVLALVFDLAPLGVLFGSFVVVPVVALVSIFVALKLALRVMPHGAGPGNTRRVVLVGGLFVVWAVALLVVVALDRRGSGQLTFALPFLAAAVVGLATIAAALFHSWHRTSARARVALGLGGLFVILIGLAATPGLALLANPYRHLPVATVDEAAAADLGWSVVSVRDQAPNYLEIRLRDDRDRSTRIWIDHFSARCDGDECSSYGPVSAGTIRVSQRSCPPERFTIPEVLVDLGPGSLTVNSDAFRSACSDDPPDLTVEELVLVADAIREATPDEFREFAAQHP